MSELDLDSCAQGAVRWALSRLGWRGYVGLCYAFVEDAYESGNEIWLNGQGRTATEAALAYDAAARDGIPEPGAYVCYECCGPIDGVRKNWGHIGLCIGNGQVVHAWDTIRVDSYRAVERLQAPGWSQPRYVGWVPAERVLQGARPK